MNRKKFEDDFNRTRKAFFVAWLIGLTITLGLLGFLVWVIVMLMRFFEVI